MDSYSLFTSESVSSGHPDKIADQISDGILDAILKDDPMGRVACEVLVKTGMVLVAGEISTDAWVDIEPLTREIINDIGYTDAAMGFDGDACAVLSAIGKQSKDIAAGVNVTADHEQGAGDQGLMFGFACRETDVLMPAPIAYAHRLMMRQNECRRLGVLSWLRPDAKCQVTFRYLNQQPVGIQSIVLSTQHDPSVDQATLIEAVMDEIIKPVIPAAWIDDQTKFYINPTGRFVIGGPVADCGLTGRKIIVDTYGGMARHGGGCFSGKDPSKVDRSAAYMGRYIAKNVVAAGLADRCEVQLSYAIGVAAPTAVSVNSFGTAKIDEQALAKCIYQVFDMRPQAIIQQLNLLRPIYRPTAAYGHFGRPEFTWEATDKVEHLQSVAGIKIASILQAGSPIESN